MTSPCKIISNTRFNIGNDSFTRLGSNNRRCFCAKEHCIIRISMQRVGVDLCKCHAPFTRLVLDLLFTQPLACMFPSALRYSTVIPYLISRHNLSLAKVTQSRENCNFTTRH